MPIITSTAGDLLVYKYTSQPTYTTSTTAGTWKLSVEEIRRLREQMTKEMVNGSFFPAPRPPVKTMKNMW